MNTIHLSLKDLESFDTKSPTAGRERRFLCPLCGLNKPRDGSHRSLSVNSQTGNYICHRCHVKGRLKEFWETRPITSRKEKTRLKLISHFSINGKISSETATKMEISKKENFDERMNEYQKAFVHSKGENYLVSRGICVETAVNAGCGFADKWVHWEKNNEKWISKGKDKRVVFPIYSQEGKLVAYHGRAVDDYYIGSAKLTRGDKSYGLFLSDAYVFERKVLAICEGAIDALSLKMSGISAVAMTGTTPPDWFYKKMAFRCVLIATDADEAGDKAAFQIKSELISRGSKVLRLRPKGSKDWNEVLECIGLEEMQNSLKAFHENISDEDRAEESLKFFNSGRYEAAEFIAELITSAELRQNLLYRIRTTLKKAA